MRSNNELGCVYTYMHYKNKGQNAHLFCGSNVAFGGVANSKKLSHILLNVAFVLLYNNLSHLVRYVSVLCVSHTTKGHI